MYKIHFISEETEILQHMAKMKAQGKDPGPPKDQKPKKVFMCCY